ncbi:MAG: arginine--tRNA ligase [Rhabdochlamydiaceae bacterium]|nr:arginine--tRNA ligase [Rhabdochlamydiaceae bacterium]
MQNIVTDLIAKFQHALHAAFGALVPADFDGLRAEVTQSTQTQFGHYQCNNALKLAKELKKSPRDVAALLIANVDPKTSLGEPMIAKMEIAGPGFINITLDLQFLSLQTQAILSDERLGVPLPEKKQRVVVEFSSPNVAKELHVGHLRSTIIGDAIARLFEFLGHDVLRLNHIGDWGTQFGMLIAFMRETVPDVLTGVQNTDLSQLMQWYRESKKRFDADPEFKKRSQLQVVALQGGDPAALHAWQIICDISQKAFQEIYALLDVKIQVRGESFYNPELPKVIADLEQKGLISISDGAKCLFLDGFTTREGTPLPMIVQKSDGGFNYDTTDVAAMRHRVDVEKADRIIILTDAGQSLHFAMLAKACEKAGYLDPKRTQFDHVPFGVVLGPDGTKFKTRSGDTEKLIDLLQGAIAKAKEILTERLPEYSADEIEKMAAVLGIDALKYADLSCHRLKDYVFSYERMLKFEGNTAAFLLYAFVRIQGIKRKVGKNIAELISHTKITLNHLTEVELALHLRQFGETLDMMSRDLLPNRLCEYLYVLAEKFHAFFRDCRVEGSPEEDSRLVLCEATARILEKGLHLLGLKTLERM